MGASRAPELAAADTQTRTVLITAVPGRGLDMLRLPAEQERAAYEQAGELLARFHTAAADEPTPEATEEAWDEAVAQLLDRMAAYGRSTSVPATNHLPELPGPARNHPAEVLAVRQRLSRLPRSPTGASSEYVAKLLQQLSMEIGVERGGNTETG